MRISLLCWFLLIGVFGSGSTKHSSFFTEDLGVYIFSLFFNLLADALHKPGVNDLDSRPFDSVRCLANWKKRSHWIKHTEEEEKSISLQHALITCKLPCTIFTKMKYYQKDIIGNTKKFENVHYVLLSTCRSLQSLLWTGNFQHISGHIFIQTYPGP